MALKLAAGTDVEEAHKRFPKPGDRLSDEIVIALVGPLGSGCSETARVAASILKTRFGYESKIYKPSDLIAESLRARELQQGLDPREFTTEDLQKEGNRLRQEEFGGYLAARLIQQVARDRQLDEDAARDGTETGERRATNRRLAHIVDSLKHPEEYELLRQTYGPMFWLVGVFAPEDLRKSRLAEKWRNRFDNNALAVEIQKCISADYKDGDDLGQAVRDLFYQADYFINNDQSSDTRLQSHVARFLDAIFGAPIKTPTVEESSMYAAYAQAARSACMSRQVGASIVDRNGVVIGLGRNDVPKYGGGLYDEGDGTGDHRCFRWKTKQCHNQHHKNEIVNRIESLVRPSGKDAVSVKAQIKGVGVNSLLEFSRSIHAEMEAILSVARTGKAGLVGATLYTTTFPCHNCARHIIAAGIERVVYVEPFPKSEAVFLHSDALCEPKSVEHDSDKVTLVQYSGFGPKRFLEIFSVGNESRKTPDGGLMSFDFSQAKPKIRNSLDSFSTLEKLVVANLN